MFCCCYRMRRLLISLTIIAYANSSPQRQLYEQSDRPGPGQLQAYVKFSPSDVRHLKTRGYALPVATASPIQIPSGFRSTISPHFDNSVAPSQQRRGQYDDENYPVQHNSLQQIHSRPQQPQRRPAGGHTTQFRQQLEEVRFHFKVPTQLNEKLTQ